MRENTLKQKLESRQAVFGVMITFPSAPVVEMQGHLGFDWVLIDNEHGSITVENSEDLVRAAELTGIAPIVRPVANKPEIIAPFLDRGAWGVQVPHVNTAQEAAAAVDAVKYYPHGHRGIFSRNRAADYGFSGSTADYVEEANRNTLVCLMLEEVEAIQNLKEEGVTTIREAGRVAGVSCPDNLVPKFLDMGVQYFHGNVNTLIQTSSVAYLTEMRQGAKAAGL